MSLEPLLAWLRTGRQAPLRLDFPVGTALPDGRLDLCKSDLGPLGAKAVVEALPHGGPVRHLLLGTDQLGDEGAAKATEGAIEAGASTIYLGCNGIGEGGACTIATRIAASPGVVHGLWLKRNPLGPSGLQAIADLVATGNAPATIDLVQTGVTAPILDDLVEALAATRVVRRLFLSGNPLGGAEALTKLVRDCGLEELYLSACQLGDRGAAYVRAGLNEGLKRLSVASNGISAHAMTGLFDAAVLAGVEVLDLGRVRAAGVLDARDNRVDAAALAETLSAGPHQLRHLDLRSTGLDGRGSVKLLAGAERAVTATRYILGGGLPKRIKGKLGHLAADVPALAPHPDVAAIKSVHR
ncbi:ribonuclease inhibitor [Actinocrispum sp. NPDC049592]|uniref:ribonuclease inhibitor n=1 Tax=Actinocrispum sp. NPDC049592 TaxID=3154835 RepID=UPI00343CEC04